MLDELDRRILDILAANARVSLKELAQEAGLSSPSAAERLRKLEERGVLDGFTIALNPVKLGYPLQAIIRVRPMPGMLHIVEKLIQETPQIRRMRQGHRRRLLHRQAVRARYGGTGHAARSHRREGADQHVDRQVDTGQAALAAAYLIQRFEITQFRTENRFALPGNGLDARRAEAAGPACRVAGVRRPRGRSPASPGRSPSGRCACRAR